MKAIKDFYYYVDGNNSVNIEKGSDIPLVAQPFAEKNGLCEKQKQAPLNKARKAPLNKARK